MAIIAISEEEKTTLSPEPPARSGYRVPRRFGSAEVAAVWLPPRHFIYNAYAARRALALFEHARISRATSMASPRPRVRYPLTACCCPPMSRMESRGGTLEGAYLRATSAVPGSLLVSCVKTGLWGYVVRGESVAFLSPFFKSRRTASIVFQLRVVAGTPNSLSIWPR